MLTEENWLLNLSHCEQRDEEPSDGTGNEGEAAGGDGHLGHGGPVCRARLHPAAEVQHGWRHVENPVEVQVDALVGHTEGDGGCDGGHDKGIAGGGVPLGHVDAGQPDYGDERVEGLRREQEQVNGGEVDAAEHGKY